MTPHVIAVAISSVKPISGKWSYLAEFIVVFVYVLGFRLSCVSLVEMSQQLGEAVLDALNDARLSAKEAAALMGWDESNMRKALRGEPSHHLSLNRLAELPTVFWLHFIPRLTYIVIRRNVQDIADTVGLRRP